MPEIQKVEEAGGKKLPSHAKVVVIGGGVVGCSILFHLAKFGWKRRGPARARRTDQSGSSPGTRQGQIHTISHRTPTFQPSPGLYHQSLQGD